MSNYFYKSEAPEVVSIVQEYYQAKDLLNEQLAELGKLFGGAIAPMRDITSHFAGGVKLSASRELDVHWCRPDDYGYRTHAGTRPGSSRSGTGTGRGTATGTPGN